jgi:hypothetical protein
MKKVLVIGDGSSELVKAMLAIIEESKSGDIIVGDPCAPIMIRCHDLLDDVVTYDMRQQQSFTPPHKKNRRGKYKRPGR